MVRWLKVKSLYISIIFLVNIIFIFSVVILRRHFICTLFSKFRFFYIKLKS